PVGRGALAAVPEIDAAGQLADDEHVSALDDLRAERRQGDHLRVDDDRPQVHEEIERAAEAEDRRCLNAAPLRVMRLGRRAAERALEDGVSAAAGVERGGGKMLAVALPCLATGV